MEHLWEFEVDLLSCHQYSAPWIVSVITREGLYKGMFPGQELQHSTTFLQQYKVTHLGYHISASSCQRFEKQR